MHFIVYKPDIIDSLSDKGRRIAVTPIFVRLLPKFGVALEEDTFLL